MMSQFLWVLLCNLSRSLNCAGLKMLKHAFSNNLQNGVNRGASLFSYGLC